jgi:hypothetical protein
MVRIPACPAYRLRAVEIPPVPRQAVQQQHDGAGARASGDVKNGIQLDGVVWNGMRRRLGDKVERVIGVFEQRFYDQVAIPPAGLTLHDQMGLPD